MKKGEDLYNKFSKKKLEEDINICGLKLVEILMMQLLKCSCLNIILKIK